MQKETRNQKNKKSNDNNINNNCWNYTRDDEDMAKKVKSQEKETESLLIAIQNNLISINFIKAKIDYVWLNSKCRLWRKKRKRKRESDIKRKTKELQVWDLCKRFKFKVTITWYLHKPESVQENKTHKIICDYVLQ